MARYTGAVRFNDGGLMYFVYNGTVDQARPRLYESEEAAFAAWDKSADAVDYCRAEQGADEPVEVMPYFAHGDHDVMFYSRASRELKTLTGALSKSQAAQDEVERPKFRPQRGGYEESMALRTDVRDLQMLADVIGIQFGKSVDTASISTVPEGYDRRNGWDTYAVTVDGQGVGYMNCDLSRLRPAHPAAAFQVKDS